MWRENIKRVWVVYPLVWSECTGDMRIIKFIYKRDLINKILIHMQLYQERKNERAPPATILDYVEPGEMVPAMLTD